MLQKLYPPRAHGERARAARDRLTPAEARRRNLKGRPQRVSSSLQTCPSTGLPGRQRGRPRRRGGGGTCHLAAPDPGEVSADAATGPPTRGAWGPRRALPAAPGPCAARRGRGPSRGTASPRPLARRLRPAGPIASGRVPKAPRLGGTEKGGGGARTDLLETGPPSAYSPSLRAAGSALVSLFPRRRRRLLRLPGRPHWALGRGRVKGRRWARAGRRSRGGPASRQALTGPGAQGQADRGGERGCRLR